MQLALLLIILVRNLIRLSSYIYFTMLLATMVKFSESTYEFDEGSGLARVLVLISNPPPSSDITVEVVSVDITAIGKRLV